MSDHNTSELLNNLVLGKQTDYISNYSPELLQGVPRSLTRESLGFDEIQTLPFKGFDRWTGYEVSWLNAKGKPQVCIAEFQFPCDSTFLVESKSFKLYLNSFNQSKYQDHEAVKNLLQQDLSKVCGKPVQVNLFTLEQYTNKGLNQLPNNCFCLDDLDISVEEYDYKPELLSIDKTTTVSEALCSHLLKSNCLITSQPDWGSVFIQYTGPALNKERLLKYIISFRGHNEFHEHCVERIFSDLYKLLEPSELTVYARYTRRGGLDINPLRTTLAEPQFAWQRLARQ